MHLELIKVTKDLRQDRWKQFTPGTGNEDGVCPSFDGDLTWWIKHFKAQDVKTYLKYGGRDWKPTCALYREVLPSDKDWLAIYPIYAEKVLATELSSVEGYVYPRKGKEHDAA